MNDLPRNVWSDTDVYRSVGLIEVETIKRGGFDDPAREIAATDTWDDEVRRKTQASADRSAGATNLMARVLVDRRMDPPRNVPRDRCG